MPAIAMKKEVQVQAKTISIYAKCSDCCSASLKDQDGNEIQDHDGYVPSFMPGEHFGDYLILEIDLDTGKILNWKPPTADQIEEWIAEHHDDDRQ